ncbi:MAG TPA: diguanylate cyclase [Gemmatimonadales bacterium]|nr:diguanylate cyclase [Gemmatimonadales bacterium]
MTNGNHPEPLARLRLVLTGDASARPEGLERALTRAGFHLTEVLPPTGEAPPDALLITLARHDDGRMAQALESLGQSPPRVVLFATESHEAPTAALGAGADDALAAPVHFPELCARIEARIRDRQAPRRTPYEAQVRRALEDLLAEARGTLQPAEIVLALVRRLARAFALARCSFVLTTPGEEEGRVVAEMANGHTEPRLDLSRYPEIAEAIRSRRPVTMPDVQGAAPDVPAGTLVVLPVLAETAVPAVLLLRPGSSQPHLSAAQLELAATLAQTAARALENGSGSHRDAKHEIQLLDRRLQEEFERARRYSLSFSLVLLDVAAGADATAAGEEMRREVGVRLRRELRLPDFVSRYDRDEFAIVLPETGTQGARRSVTRMRERLGTLAAEPGAAAERPSFSAGIVSFPHPAAAQPDDMYALVEAALMRGKAQTGERIGIAE